MIYYHYHIHDFILFSSLFASESTSKLWCCSARPTWGRWLCHNDQHKYDGDNYGANDDDNDMTIKMTIMMTMIEFDWCHLWWWQRGHLRMIFSRIMIWTVWCWQWAKMGPNDNNYDLDSEWQCMMTIWWQWAKVLGMQMGPRTIMMTIMTTIMKTNCWQWPKVLGIHADGPMAIMTTIMMTMIEFEFKGAGYADGPKEEAFESSGGEKVDPFAISTKISFP